jgi:sugar O-acyltransferase (sialic acid O-acetyltransferase NeuD family)
MMRVLIVGAGGHAQVVADILLRMGEQMRDLSVLGYLDDNPAIQGTVRLGLRVLGGTPDLATIAHDRIVIAIGDNRTRAAWFQRLWEDGERFLVACHPRAAVAPDVRIGPGTMICAGVVVNPTAAIGANVILNTGCTIDHHNRIGSDAHIAPGAHLGGEVSVGDGALIGIGATVMPGRTVGPWSTVAAGALVHRDVPPGALAMGVPARILPRPLREETE